MQNIRERSKLKVKRCLGIIKKNKYVSNDRNWLPCIATYCSKECQLKDWINRHHLICRKSKKREKKYKLNKKK